MQDDNSNINTDSQEEISPEEQLKLWGRKQRPLPKQGCSIAFFALFVLLIAYLIIKYIQFRNQ
jgi:hypothetical protein